MREWRVENGGSRGRPVTLCEFEFARPLAKKTPTDDAEKVNFVLVPSNRLLPLRSETSKPQQRLLFFLSRIFKDKTQMSATAQGGLMKKTNNNKQLVGGGE